MSQQAALEEIDQFIIRLNIALIAAKQAREAIVIGDAVQLEGLIIGLDDLLPIELETESACDYMEGLLNPDAAGVRADERFDHERDEWAIAEAR